VTADVVLNSSRQLEEILGPPSQPASLKIACNRIGDGSAGVAG
jgi:hypothetical protein